MSTLKQYLIVTAAMLLAAASAYAGIPERPSPPRLVNDFAGIFTKEQANSLEHALVAFDDSTSNQMAIITVSDLEGYEPADYASRIGIKRGVGGKKYNNGIVLLVKPKNNKGGGKVSIQVGYGLEGAIPDAYCKRIIEGIMIPLFKEDDYYGAVTKASSELMMLASGEISEPRVNGGEDEDGGTGIFTVILALIIIFIAARKAKRHTGGGSSGSSSGGSSTYTGGTYYGSRRSYSGRSSSSSSGRSSGRSSGGGSFRGFGGGSFGGGGASGSW